MYRCTSLSGLLSHSTRTAHGMASKWSNVRVTQSFPQFYFYFLQIVIVIDFILFHFSC